MKKAKKKIKKNNSSSYNQGIEKTSSKASEEIILQSKDTKKASTFFKTDESIVQSSDQYKKEVREKEWYIFSISFLNIAKNSCDNITLKKKLSNDDKFVFIGIVYNVKHSLEIILKAFARTINKNLDKSDFDHDIDRLMKDFRKKSKKI